MKPIKQNPIIFFILCLLFNPLTANENKLEEMLASSLESEADANDSNDPDDMILKMKTFFDSYANKLKNSIKGVDKVILPSNEEPKVEYVNNFNMNDIKRKGNDFVEDNNSIREKDLKNARESKQNVEEKYIDLITKNKILNSRMNIGSGDKNKVVGDFNEKNNIKLKAEAEVKDFKGKLEKLVADSVDKMKNLKESLRNYNAKISKVELNQKLFEDEVNVQNNLEKLKIDNFKVEFETNFLNSNNSTVFEFNNKVKNLDEIFKTGFRKLDNKISHTENSIRNKTDAIKKMKRDIEDKYAVYENLNNTVSKLKKMQTDYRNALRNLEEELNLLKSKKKIIEDNIIDKKKVRNIRKKTVEMILDNSQKELNKFNVDKINVNKYRKELSLVNNRIRSLLIKENMIFKKNKIKI